MNKIGTHNSATGEKGKGWLSWLVTPFAKCQSKTIKEQYLAGCRMFDIRVRWHKGRLVCAHGLWRSRIEAFHVLLLLDKLKDCIVILTYEGNPSIEELQDFEDAVLGMKNRFKNITWREVCIKKDWTCIMPSETKERNTKDFATKDHNKLFTLLPIPWVWKLFKGKVTFDNNTYKLVDFL